MLFFSVALTNYHCHCKQTLLTTYFCCFVNALRKQRPYSTVALCIIEKYFIISIFLLLFFFQHFYPKTWIPSTSPAVTSADDNVPARETRAFALNDSKLAFLFLISVALILSWESPHNNSLLFYFIYEKTEIPTDYRLLVSQRTCSLAQYLSHRKVAERPDTVPMF